MLVCVHACMRACLYACMLVCMHACMIVSLHDCMHGLHVCVTVVTNTRYFSIIVLAKSLLYPSAKKTIVPCRAHVCAPVSIHRQQHPLASVAPLTLSYTLQRARCLRALFPLLWAVTCRLPSTLNPQPSPIPSPFPPFARPFDKHTHTSRTHARTHTQTHGVLSHGLFGDR